MNQRIVYGKWTWEAADMFSGHYGQATSLSISVLSLDTFRATVLCDDPSVQDIVDEAPLEYYEDDIKRAVYYVDAITRIGPQKYTLSALSPLSRLAQKTHYGGIYTGQNVEDVIGDICGEIPFIIKSNLLGTKIYNWLPIANARSNLQQVLLILGANLWTDHDGVLRISALWDGLTSVIDADRVYAAGASARRDKPVTHVTVLEHAYAPGTDRRELFSGTATQGQRIPFDGPMSALEAEGLTILDSGANYAVVAAGSGKLTGCPYIHTTLEVTRQVSTAAVKNEVRIEDATLVSLVNSAAVANRLVNYYACRETIQVDAVLRQEHPGEVVQIIHPYDRTMVKACISAAEVELSATLKGSLTALVGFEPEQSGESEYFDERVVLTGEGDWIPPEGTEEVRAVLIGAGTGGWSGRMGGQATLGQRGSYSAGNIRNQRLSTGTGGPGGEAGLGGDPGKVLQVELTVTPGVPIHYRSGTPGAGGISDKVNTQPTSPDASNPGSPGTDSTFGPYSSGDGSASPAGYYDQVTGETFASLGEPGIPGGDGGGRDPDSNLWQAQKPGPDVVYKGVTYHGGPNNQQMVEDAGSVSAEQTTLKAGAFFGAGGGAAAGSDGKKSFNSPGVSVTPRATVAASSIFARGGSGGRGADAVAPDPETTIGKGGKGGNGGGGVGGGGYAEALAQKNSSTSAPSFPTDATTTQYFYPAYRGLGSDGSQGGPGGIILYYRRKKKINAGAFVTKSKNFFLDKSGRLFIV